MYIEQSDVDLSRTDVTVGIRPQHVMLSQGEADVHFEGVLTLLEPVEESAIATIDGPDGELRAVTPYDRTLAEEETVNIQLDTEKLYIFDAESRELLATGEKEVPSETPAA